jgi:hypothetical protein
LSSARKVEWRITSGADIIIRNVLPFLQLSEWMVIVIVNDTPNLMNVKI